MSLNLTFSWILSLFFIVGVGNYYLPQVNSEKVDVDLIVHDMYDDFLFTTEYVKIRLQLQILC